LGSLGSETGLARTEGNLQDKMNAETSEKRSWEGMLVSVQPRIRLTRSFDERSHSYLGYALRVRGRMGVTEAEFSVGIGKAAQAKHGFQAGDVVTGCAEAVRDPRLEPVDFYKASALKLLSRNDAEVRSETPPWVGVPPELAVYRERGHRRLDPRTYESRCVSCIWGCRMSVEMIVDHWNPSQRRYRSGTFCYGPKSCSFYRAGATRKVPGRRGMTWEEADWVDVDATAHRADDE
jgi:hypothetical protein